jgi:phosphatidylserine/phosphatidylglycerophosphate/cardiolipin synthase-like enzyme
MPRRPARAHVAACLFLLASLAPGRADPAPVIHYAPIENLEHVDVALIDRAEHQIDMAAYVLTDWPILQALTRAADRGVKVRIYLDGTQLGEREPTKVFNDLAETPGVEIRTKHKSSDPMHLKSYQIDGRLLRTGAANFSASGLKRQDNDFDRD